MSRFIDKSPHTSDEALLTGVEALLDLNARGAFTDRIPGLAIQLLQSLAARLEARGRRVSPSFTLESVMRYQAAPDYDPAAVRMRRPDYGFIERTMIRCGHVAAAKARWHRRNRL